MTIYYVDMHLINSTLYKHGICLIKDVHLIGHDIAIYWWGLNVVDYLLKKGELKLAGIHLVVTGYTALSYSRIRTQKNT